MGGFETADYCSLGLLFLYNLEGCSLSGEIVRNFILLGWGVFRGLVFLLWENPLGIEEEHQILNLLFHESDNFLLSLNFLFKLQRFFLIYISFRFDLSDFFCEEIDHLTHIFLKGSLIPVQFRLNICHHFRTSILFELVIADCCGIHEPSQQTF